MYIPDGPVNIKLLDVDEFIRSQQVKRVESHAIFEASSNSTIFQKDGLFSEDIFGAVGSTARLSTFGYIELNAAVLQPFIYNNLVRLSALYGEIIDGTSYATFDSSLKNFKKCKASDAGARTGFTFFMEYFSNIDFTTTDSHVRSDRIAIIEKYRDILFIKRMLVLPAGLRDVQNSGGRLSQDDINKLYQTLLAYSSAIPPGVKSPIFDGIRVNIQKKVVEIYEYIENIVTDKRGFLQEKYGKRRIALGTRNVISSTSYKTVTPDDPQAISSDETRIGLYQTMKGMQPIVIHHFRTAILDPVFKTDSNTIAVTDPDTLMIQYREVSNKELNKFSTNLAIETLISRFANADIRELPIAITDVTGKKFYICMVYDTGDEIALFRSITDLEAQLKIKADRKKLHPLTWVEAFYMVTYMATQGRHVFISRYPIIQDESCYPTKIHLTSTMPARIVHLRDLLTDSLTRTYPEYPIFGNSYHDSISPALSKLAGLGGD